MYAANMAITIKVFVLTKNEYDIIDDFITYYSQMLGAHNVIIIDNGSTDSRVLSAYSRHPDVHLIHDHRAMTEQRHMMTDAMMKHVHTCDFMMPLDTDEFAMWNDTPITDDSLHAFLQALPKNVDIIRYNAVWFSVPDHDDATYVNYSHVRPVVDIVKFQRKPFDKIIVRSSAFAGMNPGNHSALLRNPYSDACTAYSLSLLHFHDVGVRRTYERTLAAVTSYGFVTSDASLDHQMISCGQFVNSIGGHHAVHYLRFLVRRIFINVIREATGLLPSLVEMLTLSELCESWIQGKDHIVSGIEDFGRKILTHVLQYGIDTLQTSYKPENFENLNDVRVHATASSASDVERFLIYGVGWSESASSSCVTHINANMKKVFSGTNISNILTLE